MMLSKLSLGEENARGIIDIAVVIGIVVGLVVVVSVVVSVVIISLQTGKQICIDWLVLGNSAVCRRQSALRVIFDRFQLFIIGTRNGIRFRIWMTVEVHWMTVQESF